MGVMVAGLVMMAIGAGAAKNLTGAFFTDTEISTGNTFTAGRIDLVVNQQNPLASKVVELGPMDPGSESIITKNLVVTDNPSNIWMQIKDIVGSQGTSTEPECVAESGTWTGTECSSPINPKFDLETQIYYYLSVCLDDNGNYVCDSGETKVESFMAKDAETLATLNGKWVQLWKSLPSGKILIIEQSFHFKSTAGNEYQGDVVTFTEIFGAYQLGAPTPTGNTLELENKNPTTWMPIIDGRSGTLTYNQAGPTFDYTFTGQGLQASTNYCLIYYAEPWAGNHPGALIATMTTDGSGSVTQSASVNLNMDLPTSPDYRYPAGAKIWLVPCSGYDSVNKKITGWNPTSYLFENNPILINYDDTDAP